MNPAVVHFQLRAADTDGLARFYEHVLGWSTAPATMGLHGSDVVGPYRWVESGPDGIAGGIVHDDHPAGAVVIVAVDDVASTVERVSPWAGTPTVRRTTCGCAGPAQASTGSRTPRSWIPKATGSA